MHNGFYVVSIAPGYLAELRWFAAKALAAELRAAGARDQILLRDVVVPIRVGRLCELAEEEFGEAAADWSLEQRFERLRAAGGLEMREVVIGG